MQSRHVFMVCVTIALVAALFGIAGRSQQSVSSPQPIQTTIENVRDYAAGVRPGAPAYAIDGGRLLVGQPGYWREISLPEGVIAGAVALAPASPGTQLDEVYVGAANELAVYRSSDQGQTWLRTQLTHQIVHGNMAGGVTDLAVDPVQRLVYAATDTAGLFRLRDADQQLQVSAQLVLQEPVLQVVTDHTGQGLAMARTAQHLYRATDYGLTWMQEDTLQSQVTALAITGAERPRLLVGTVDRGLLQQEDGESWQSTNHGLATNSAQRIQIDALATDPLQPEVVYVATSQLVGLTAVKQIPDLVAYSLDSGVSWRSMEMEPPVSRVVELLPMSGHHGGVYLLTLTSRTPYGVGNVPSHAPPPMAIEPAAGRSVLRSEWVAWIMAGLAAFALIFALLVDLFLSPPLVERNQKLQPVRPNTHLRQ